MRGGVGSFRAGSVSDGASIRLTIVHPSLTLPAPKHNQQEHSSCSNLAPGKMLPLAARSSCRIAAERGALPMSILTFALLSVLCAQRADRIGTQVDDFALRDHQGKQYRLS